MGQGAEDARESEERRKYPEPEDAYWDCWKLCLKKTTMKTKEEIKTKIRKIEKSYKHVLTGSLATVYINAPRALEQIAAQTKLATLHWVLGSTYKSKLKGVNL